MSDGFRPFVVRTFELALWPGRRLGLHGPLLAGPRGGIDPGRPILLVANHASWWDGFIVRDIQRLVRPGSRLFTLMTERELRRHPYLRWMGCVGMEGGRPGSVLRAFRRLQHERQRENDALFAVFPQGAIWPVTRRPLGFARGVSVLAALLAPVTIVPVGIRLEPLNRPTPTAFVSLGHPVAHAVGQPDHRELEAAVEGELDRMGRFLQAHGEAAPRHWPPADDRARGS